MPKVLLCACHCALPYLEIRSKTVVESPYCLHTWRTNQCDRFQLEVAALVLSHFSQRQGPPRLSPGRERFTLWQTSEWAGDYSKPGIPTQNSYMYILEWLGRRSQLKVIPCSDPPMWWNGVLVPKVPFTAETGCKPDSKALRPIRKISSHSGITFLFSCSGVPQRTLQRSWVLFRMFPRHRLFSLKNHIVRKLL